MKRVLLINPWIEDFAAYDFWIKPIGLLKIAEWLNLTGCYIKIIDCINRNGVGDRRDSTGKFRAVIIDKPEPVRGIPRPFRRYGISTDNFRNELYSFPEPDFVLITCCMTYWYTGAFRAIRIVREVYPNVKIVFGGNYPFLSHEHCQKLSGADHIIISRKYQDIETSLSGILNIKPPPVSLKDIPPAYYLYKHLNSIPVVTSYGCPFRCSYCASHKLYPDFWQIPPADVIAELELYGFKYDISDIAFFDDALFVNAETHIEPILDWIINNGRGCSFHLPNAVHPRYITRILVDKMRKAGFRTIRLGFESSDPVFQRNSGDKVTSEELEQAAGYLKEAGFTSDEVGAYILYGNPGYDIGKVRASVEFVKRLGLRALIATYSPIPKTENFKTVSQEDHRLINEPLLQNPVLCRYKNFEEYSRLKAEANSD